MKKSKLASQYILLIFLMVLRCVSLEAKSKMNDSVTISLRLEGPPKGTSGALFHVSVVKPNALTGWSGYTSSYKAVIHNNMASLTIPGIQGFTYACFRIEHSDLKVEYLDEKAGGLTPYILNKGDQVQIQISKAGNVTFLGKGAVKLQCQQNIYRQMYMSRGMSNRLEQIFADPDLGTTLTELQTRDNFVVLNLQMKMAILNSYKQQLPDSIYKLIKYDCIGQQLLEFYGYYYRVPRRAVFEKYKDVISTYLKKKQDQMPINQEDNKWASLSAYYAEGLMMKEKAQLLFFSSTDSLKNRFAFNDLYESIDKKYTGAVRDKLFLIAVINIANGRNQGLEFINKIENSIVTPLAKNMLQNWLKANRKGTPAFPFQLTDEHGKTHELSEYKGKLIVADFWFTGCKPCQAMAKALTLVSRHFKDNPNIKFLSINVDKVKSTWDRGLKSGAYTFPDAIHLSTYGAAKGEHPLLKHYNFNLYPQLMVIDPNGIIISTNPPNPRLDNGAELIRVLDQNLK